AAFSIASTFATLASLAAWAATEPASSAQTATSIDPPIDCAQVTHFAVLALSVEPSCSATMRIRAATSEESLFLERGDELRGIFHADPFLALLRRLEPNRPHASGSGLDAECREGERLGRLAFRLHDVRELHVARLVESQVRREDGGQVHLERLEPGIDLTHGGRSLARDLDLRGERCLRAPPERGKHGSRLAVVVIDRLLAEDDEKRLLALDELQQNARDGERLEAEIPRARGCARVHLHCAVGAHRARGTQLLLRVCTADARDDDLVGGTALLDTQRLLERDLIEGIDAHLGAFDRSAAAVRLDPDTHVVVDDALDADQYLVHQPAARWSAEPCGGLRCCSTNLTRIFCAVSRKRGTKRSIATRCGTAEAAKRTATVASTRSSTTTGTAIAISSEMRRLRTAVA